MDRAILLQIDGAVEHALALTFDDLASRPEPAQIPDISRLHAKRAGAAVTLESLLEEARPHPEADYLTLHADRDDFHVSVPLAAVRTVGIVVYKQGAGPLALEQGGPIRFLIPDPAVCHTDELDDCANVKYLSRIELTVHRGRDTRPADEAAHATLHAGGPHSP